MDIDLPDVVTEVRAAFERYEAALVSNDVEALGSLFHDDPRTIRYGGGENLYGYDEIAAFRAGRSPLGLARELSRTGILRSPRRCSAVPQVLGNRQADAELGEVRRRMEGGRRACQHHRRRRRAEAMSRSADHIGLGKSAARGPSHQVNARCQPAAHGV